MRIGRITFSRSFLYAQAGITTELFKEMLDRLPKDSKIAGFSSDWGSLVDYLFIENPMFIDIPDGSIPPEIDVAFTREFDGTTSCSKVDWSRCVGASSMAATPNSLVNGNVAIPKKACFQHEFETYTGLNTVEQVCKHCGVRKP